MKVDGQGTLPNDLKVLCLVADAPVAGAWVTATRRLNYPETFGQDLRALIATLKPHEGQDMTLTLVEADPPEAGRSVKLRRRPL